MSALGLSFSSMICALSRKVTPDYSCIDQYRVLRTDKQKSRYTGKIVETDIDIFSLHSLRD